MAMRDLINGGAACAVPGSSSSSNPLVALTNALLGSSSKTQLVTVQSTDTEEGAGLKPTTAIVMIVFVSAFFSLGCVFVFYMRRCLAQALDRGSSDTGGNWLNVRQTACGLDASVVGTFPTFLYSNMKTLRIGKAALECPVCLDRFEDEETLRLIPQCCHVFHTGCVDAWLRSHDTCPLCRANLVPVPGESVSFEDRCP